MTTGYSRGDLKLVEALLRASERLRDHGRGVIGTPLPGASYDALLLAAQRWALEAVVALHGPLPADLERRRAALVP